MAGLPGYTDPNAKKYTGLPLPTAQDKAAQDARFAATQRVVNDVTRAVTPAPVPPQQPEVYTGVVQRGLPAAPVASPGYAASPWERNVQSADDRGKQASFDATNTPGAGNNPARAAAMQAQYAQPVTRGAVATPVAPPSDLPRWAQGDLGNVLYRAGNAMGNLPVEENPMLTGRFGMSLPDVEASNGPASRVAVGRGESLPLSNGPSTRFVAGVTDAPSAAPEGPFVDPATSRRAQGTGADKYDLAVKQAYDLQTPFQPNNEFSDSTSGTGDQHLRPTGWNAQTGQVNLPTAPMSGGGAPTFGGMNATQYLASMKAQDAQGRVDANTARLERAREIDMNSARYDIGRAQGINGNRMNAQLYKSASQQLAALEAARVADNLNATELSKTDALVAGDLQKADITGQYGLQQADITGRYGMMGDYATAEAAGSVAQAGIDKARIAADGVVRAAGLKNAPGPKELMESQLLAARVGQVQAAMGNGDMNTVNALLVGQLPPGGKIVANPMGGFMFATPGALPTALSPADIENLMAQAAAQAQL